MLCAFWYLVHARISKLHTSLPSLKRDCSESMSVNCVRQNPTARGANTGCIAIWTSKVSKGNDNDFARRRTCPQEQRPVVPRVHRERSVKLTGGQLEQRVRLIALLAQRLQHQAEAPVVQRAIVVRLLLHRGVV